MMASANSETSDLHYLDKIQQLLYADQMTSKLRLLVTKLVDKHLQKHNTANYSYYRSVLKHSIYNISMLQITVEFCIYVQLVYYYIM